MPTAKPTAASGPHRLQQAAQGVVAAGRVAKSSYCDHSGWGLKQGSIIKSWKRRYFVLKARELIYFAERSPSGKGIDEKGRLRVAGVDFTPEFTNALVIRGELKNQVLKLQVETNAESLEWFARLREALDRDAARAAERGQAVGGAVAMEGWLLKEGQNFKTWKRRYMTLTGRVVKYHARPGERPLGETRVNDININSARPFALDVYSDNNRILRLAAESFADIEAWDLALAHAIGKAPCFGDPFAGQQAPFLGETVEEQIACEGWLYKRGQRSTAWQKRYFTLRGAGMLQYQDGPGDNPKGEGMVVGLRLGEPGSNGVDVQFQNGRVLSVSADASREIERWVVAICDLLQLDPMALETVKPGLPAGTSVKSAALAVMATDGLRRKLSRAMSNASSTSGRTSESSGSAGADVYLAGMESYDSARWSAGVIQEEDGGRYSASSGPHKAGWLRKEGHRVRSLKRRYFVAEGRQLTYFEQIGEASKGQGTVRTAAFHSSYPNCLELTMVTGRVLRVVAESPEEIHSWFEYFITPSDSDSNSGNNALSASVERLSLGAGGRGSESAQNVALAETGEGWLLKKGKNFRSWKRRYFTLDGKKLSYAADPGASPLGCGNVQRVSLGNERPFCLDVQFQNGRILHIVANCEAEMVAWNKALHVAVLVAPSASENQDDELEADGEFDYDDVEEDREARLNNVSGAVTAAMAFKRKVSASRNARGAGAPPDRFNSLDSDESYEDGATEGDSASDLGGRGSNLEPTDLVVCSGWLRKEGGTVKSWKQRYFTLHGTTLCYFKSDNGALLRSLIVCHVVTVRTKTLCLEITTESGRKLLVASDSQVDFERWLSSLQRALVVDKERKFAAIREKRSPSMPRARATSERDVQYKVL